MGLMSEQFIILKFSSFISSNEAEIMGHLNWMAVNAGDVKIVRVQEP